MIGVGETRILVKGFCCCTSSINSSKVKLIVLLLKFLLESGGVTLTSRGGSESLSPPVGGMILAQPEVRTRIFEIKMINKEKSKNFFIQKLFGCKLNLFIVNESSLFPNNPQIHVNHDSLILVLMAPLLLSDVMQPQDYLF